MASARLRPVRTERVDMTRLANSITAAGSVPSPAGTTADDGAPAPKFLQRQQQDAALPANAYQQGTDDAGDRAGDVAMGFGLAAKLKADLDRFVAGAEQELESLKGQANRLIEHVQRQELDIQARIVAFNGSVAAIERGMKNVYANVAERAGGSEQEQGQHGNVSDAAQG